MMLQEIFYWLFNMSIVATIMGLIIILIRLIPKIPRRIFIFLWSIPFLRMIIPFGINSPYALLTLFSKITSKSIIVYQPIDDIELSMTNMIMGANEYFPITYKTSILDKVFYIASIIWLFSFLAIILIIIIAYILTLKDIEDATHLKDNIYLSDKIKTPMVYGIFKTRIVLPTSYNDKDMELIIIHEKTHIRYGHNLWRIIALLITAIHWFNPFGWLFLKLFLNDLELACDEQVLSGIGEEYKKSYALLLLKCHQNSAIFTSCFGGAKIKTRIANILSYKQITIFSSTIFIILLIIIFFVLLTNSR